MANTGASVSSGMGDNIIELNLRRAHKMIQKGMDSFSRGELKEAIGCFEKSVEALPTAEGYTYWGWMLSFNGNLDEAISLCKQAIEVDPDFGNPYNDIGTYYMKMGELERAVPWLEKAKIAKRYEPKQFPYLNLGRIYLSQGFFLKALSEFEGALVYDPSNEELRAVIARIRSTHQQRTS